MNAVWQAIGKAMCEKNFREVAIGRATVPMQAERPNLGQMKDLADHLIDSNLHATRGDVWRLHWLLGQDRQTGGLSILQHLDKLHGIINDVSGDLSAKLSETVSPSEALYPVLGLCGIDHPFRHSCAKASDSVKLQVVLNGKEVDGVRGPNFGTLSETDLEILRGVLGNASSEAHFSGVQAIGWIQPHLMHALGEFLGASACADGYTLNFEEAEEDWYSAAFLTREQVALFVVKNLADSGVDLQDIETRSFDEATNTLREKIKERPAVVKKLAEISALVREISEAAAEFAGREE